MYLDFIKFFFEAGNAHSIHSPFVFEFYSKVLKDKTVFQEFIDIEEVRESLLLDNHSINREDFGAGKKKKTKNETVSVVSSTSLKSPKWAQFLFRLVRFYKYRNILDLGTSFGITTSYIAKANADASIYTLEGCPETLKIAERTFEHLKIENITSICGNIDLTLSKTLNDLETLDFVFFDANHRKEPTIRYFEACLQKKGENSCFVFDDIYWSEDMKEAWKHIKSHPDCKICIDLFYVGIVFFRKGALKQSFMLK
jgi:predicted O-methyltransferase YrrM